MRLHERLGLRHPIVQAPMAGGPTTPALVAAVSEAGGLGSLGAAYLTPGEIRGAIAEIRRRTAKPFAVNLFVPGAEPDPATVLPAIEALAPWYERYGLGPPEPPSAPAFSFEEQLEVLIEERVPVISWIFGLPSAEALESMRRAGALLIGTATTVAEARRCAVAGVDAVVAQGAEAGGHRGSFGVEGALVGTMALVPQIVDAVRLPVLAAGGIMDGRGVAAALALGAEAAVLGTAFLACDEAGTDEGFRAALAESNDESTGLTRAFSGRWARGLRTRFAEEMAGEPIADFPLQNTLTGTLRKAARAAGDPEAVSRWAGQGSAMVRRGPAAELVARIAEELAEVRGRLCSERG